MPDIGTLGTNKPTKGPAGKKIKVMSGHEKWAGKIDPIFRKEMLELQVIEHAQPVRENESMAYLVNIYINYIDVTFKATCEKCLTRILKHFRSMRPYLKELEKNSNLLKSL